MDEQDISDAMLCLYETGMAKRCSGGRIVLRGYICLHCGADDEMEGCKAPKHDSGGTPRSAMDE